MAYLPRGIDGLYLPPLPGVATWALVQSGAAEEEWAKEFLPASAVLPYTLQRSDLGPYPSTAELLLHSDIHEVLQRAAVPALLLSTSCSPGIYEWSERHHFHLLMSDYAQQRRLEDKLWFDRFLRRHGIARPRGGAVTMRRGARLPVSGHAVVQVPDSMGGEGTYFVTGSEDVQRLEDTGVLRSGERYLMREFVTGQAYGITLLVTPGRLDLSALRLQCYYPADAVPGRAFAGIQWVFTSSLSPRLRQRIGETFLRLGALLYNRRFFGFANLDFMIDEDEELFVLECNPRMSAATPQLMGHPELLSGESAGERFLRQFIQPQRYPRACAVTSLPAPNYQGATLDVVHRGAATPGPFPVARSFASGRYALRGEQVLYLGPDVCGPGAADELCLFSYASPGQLCQAGDTLASLITNFALYDNRGEMLSSARRLLAYFRYCDVES